MIRNIITGEVVTDNHIIFDTDKLKSNGLMFYKKSDMNNYGYVFEFKKTTNRFLLAIHNFFVFFCTDVVFLDENKHIVDIKEKFKPFSLLYIPKANAKYIIEFKHNTVKSKDLKINTVLDW